jgi:YfiH family protein
VDTFIFLSKQFLYMLIHRDPSFSIFFGDSQHAIVTRTLIGLEVAHKEPFSSIAAQLKAQQIVFLRQTHSVRGFSVTYDDTQHELVSFVHEGDYLVSSVPGIGLGVNTADCLPIVVVDTVRRVVAVAHAGWRGSVDSIAVKTVERLQQQYQSKIEDLRIFFGPSAKNCCYEVQENFKENVAGFSFKDQLITQRDKKFYFSLAQCNSLQLESMGVRKEHIDMQYHKCTIDDISFCSVRRNSGALERQMTIVVLH